MIHRLEKPKDIGAVSVYGDALTGGYDGTRESLYNLIKGITDGAMLLDVGVSVVTISAAGWNENTYDLTSVFPTNRYSILYADLDFDNATGTQINEWYNAEIFMKEGNTLFVHGTKPTEDIPIAVIYQTMIATVSMVPQSVGDLIYTGEEQSPLWDNYDSRELSISGDTSAVDVGRYTALFTPNTGYRWDGGTKIAKPSEWGIISCPTWSDGTDEEIASALAAHYAGLIDLTKIWNIGDERTIHISGIEYVNAETQPEQDITMVLLHKGGKELANGDECAFVVGMKGNLEVNGVVQGVSSGYVSIARWVSSIRRRWCNDPFRSALPQSVLQLFKEHKNQTIYGGDGYYAVETVDYFTLPSLYEILGVSEYEYEGVQFDYYKVSANRQKGSSYWTRSRVLGGSTWNYINASGASAARSPVYTNIDGITVQGVI